MSGTTLRLAGFQHEKLCSDLLSEDGLERVVIGLCGRLDHPTGEILLLHEWQPVPAKAYRERAPDRVSWDTEWMVPLLEKAVRKNLSVMKFHSHPGGYERFSDLDDESDRRLFSSLHGWFDESHSHGSAVMLPDGRLFGRTVDEGGDFAPFRKITVVGDEILTWEKCTEFESPPNFSLRHAQLFGSDVPPV
jgi:proteasome lid subunit RPN8/RPN11